jgi:hypothetical protein
MNIQGMLLAVAIPAAILFGGSVIVFSKGRSISSSLQLIGSGGLMLVVLTHVAEAFQLFPWMGWGLERSAGHYLDLTGAVLGLALFPAGYLIQARRLPS